MAPASKAPASKAPASKAPAPVKCTMCGKHLTKASAQVAKQGGLCAAHTAAGRTAQTIAQHRQSLTVAVAPQGYITLANLGRTIRAKAHLYPGLTVTKLVNAIGKDAALLPPVHPIAQPVYTPNGWRWVNPWLGTAAGLKALQLGQWGKAPKPTFVLPVKAGAK